MTILLMRCPEHGLMAYELTLEESEILRDLARVDYPNEAYCRECGAILRCQEISTPNGHFLNSQRERVLVLRNEG